MKALVLGSEGMLGKDTLNYLDDIGFYVIPFSHSDLDITDFNKLDETISSIKPDIIFNCCAYTDVEKAEDELDKAREVNCKGALNLAKISKKNNSILIHFSTDYVFDGEKKSKYLPTDIPNPINNYGLTKLEGEKAIQKYCEKYYIIRTSWLYGINGNNFVEKILNAPNMAELKVVNNQIGCPTWTIDLIQATVRLLNKPFGIYHLSNSSETTWFEFAKAIVEFENKDTKILPCSDNDLNLKAKRPKYSALDNNNLLRDWKDALKDYLNTRKTLLAQADN